MSETSILTVEGVTIQLGSHVVVEDLSLSTEPGEYLTLMGPSGCGKSSLLRAIAGLVTPRSGKITLHGRTLCADGRERVKPYERAVGMVFQGQALWPHLTAEGTLEFVLKRTEKLRGKALRDRVRELLELVRVDHRATHRPAEMSGGERQRLAIARALAVKPRILLLDEPLGPLDANLRRGIAALIQDVHERYELTTIHVTHDQQEAFELGDRTALLGDGRLHQIGTHDDFLTTPATPFVGTFLS